MSIDPTFWVAVSFVIFIAALIYLKIPQKVNIALDHKINETKKELEEAEKLKDEAKNLLSDYESKLSQANEEATAIINLSKKESEKNLINSTEKFSNLKDTFSMSFENLLYAATAGMAARSPNAVANKASAIPGATTAREVFFDAAIAENEFIIPHTVPNKPIKGATDPMEARNVIPLSNLPISRVIATPIPLSIL